MNAPSSTPDAAVLAAYMREQGITKAETVVIEKFASGQSNPTFKVTAGGHNFVLRRKPMGPILPSAHAVDREFKVITALGKVGFPVPKTYALCEDAAVLGSAFYIMDCVEGRNMADLSLPGMSNAARAAIYDETNRVMAQLHAIDYTAAGLETFGRPGNYFTRQIKRWTEQYRASETETIEAMDQLIAWLPQNIPAGDETTIVHGDFRLDNMIFHATEPKILAVLDWELSTLGHPLADFSYHCLSWYTPADVYPGLKGVDIAALGIPSMEDYIAAYCQRTGRTGIDNWKFYMAFNMFRLAGIYQGIMKRALDGTASSTQAMERGRKTRPVAEMGWNLIAA